MADKLYMKDAETIIMSCFSGEQRDEDNGGGVEGSSRPRYLPQKNLWRVLRVQEWRNHSALS